MKEKFFTTKRITGMAMLSAMGVVLALLIHFPIVPSIPFLEYDPADIPIYLGTFMFGPIAGLIITLVVSIIQGVTVSSGSGFIGIIMHFFATGSYALVAGIIYKRKKSFNSALIGIAAGSLVMIGTMVLWNIIFTPIFMGVPRNVVYKLLPGILLFNVIKAVINSLITIIIYKKIHKLFKNIFYKKENKENNRIYIDIIIAYILIIASILLLIFKTKVNGIYLEFEIFYLVICTIVVVASIYYILIKNKRRINEAKIKANSNDNRKQMENDKEKELPINKD